MFMDWMEKGGGALLLFLASLSFGALAIHGLKNSLWPKPKPGSLEEATALLIGALEEQERLHKALCHHYERYCRATEALRYQAEHSKDPDTVEQCRTALRRLGSHL